MTDATEQATVE